MPRSRNQARIDLAPFVPDFVRCVRCALQDYVREHAENRHWYSERTEASIIHDRMCYYARESFGDHPDVSLKYRSNLFVIRVLGRYLIKLKRLNEDLQTQNIQTDLVLDFINQRQLELFDESEYLATNLHLGYQRGDLELASSRVWITCPNGRSLHWKWELISGALTEPVTLPTITPSSPPAEPRKARVKIKRPDREEAADEAATQRKRGDA